MPTDLDNDVKLQQHYDSGLMHKYVSFMEMYGELSMDESLDEQKRKAAEMLFRHYRRMVICMATKEFHPDFQCMDTVRLREVVKLLDNCGPYKESTPTSEMPRMHLDQSNDSNCTSMSAPGSVLYDKMK